MSDTTPVTILVEYVHRPVFHDHRGAIARNVIERDDGTLDVTHRWLTCCGQAIATWGWTEHPTEKDWSRRFIDQWDRGHRGITLRRDHAAAFARPCLLCQRAWS